MRDRINHVVNRSRVGYVLQVGEKGNWVGERGVGVGVGV